MVFLCTPAESRFNEIGENFYCFSKNEETHEKLKRFKYLCSHVHHLFLFFWVSLWFYIQMLLNLE